MMWIRFPLLAAGAALTAAGLFWLAFAMLAVWYVFFFVWANEAHRS